MHTRNPDKMLSNKLLDLQGHINRHEQAQIDILGFGDPVLNDRQLAELNNRQGHIIELKNTLRKKTAELARMKYSYYTKICRQINIGKQDSRKLVGGEYGGQVDDILKNQITK